MLGYSNIGYLNLYKNRFSGELPNLPLPQLFFRTIYFPDEAQGGYVLISDHSDRGNHPSAEVRKDSQVPDDVRLIDMNDYSTDEDLRE